MQYKRHKDRWWFEPELPSENFRIPARLRQQDPTDPRNQLFTSRPSRRGAFLPSRKWKPYNRLHPLDAGYLVPLYTLRDIAHRYGLSQSGQRYFRQHVLPEPFALMRRRSVTAHHWSRFTLMTLDVVLADLEQRGKLQFLSTYTDHVQLVQIGVTWMEQHYSEKEQEAITDGSDKFGVEWL